MAQQKGSDPLVWVIQLSSNLSSRGVSMPSVELANVLVSHICWENNVPIMWKFLEKALMLKIVPPMLVLALLSQRFVLLFSILASGFWCLRCYDLKWDQIKGVNLFKDFFFFPIPHQLFDSFRLLFCFNWSLVFVFNDSSKLWFLFLVCCLENG